MNNKQIESKCIHQQLITISFLKICLTKKFFMSLILRIDFRKQKI